MRLVAGAAADSGGSGSQEGRTEPERWMIYKRTGQWDDVVDGPDTDGVEVVPAARAEAAHRAWEEAVYDLAAALPSPEAIEKARELAEGASHDGPAQPVFALIARLLSPSHLDQEGTP